MKKLIKYQFVTVLVLTLILTPSFSQASLAVRTGDTVSIEEGQVTVGDFYSAASITNISGEITEDLVAASGRVTLNGIVGGDALILGGTVDVYGTIGDDLRIIGGEVIVAEPIIGDLFIIGGTITVLSSASIGGDVLIYGGDVTIDAPVGGSIIGRMNTLRIDGPVAGEVNVSVLSLVLGEQAAVSGDVVYSSMDQLTRAANAEIGGEVLRNDPVAQRNSMQLRSALIPVLALLFAVLAWFLVARQRLNLIAERALDSKYRPLLIGLAVIMFTPFAALVLLLSVLGTLVGTALLFTYGLVLVLGVLSMPATIGKLVLRLVRKEEKVLSPLTLVVGVVVMAAILFVPVIGPVVFLGFFIVSLGAIVDLLLKPNA